MKKVNFYEYQKAVFPFLWRRLVTEGHRGAGLALDMGDGKTLCTLHFLHHYYNVIGFRGALVVAPLNVMRSTWPAEMEKWESVFHPVIVHGSEKKRLSLLKYPTLTHFINYDAIRWLATVKELPPWDFLIVDESEFFKNWGSKRSKALRELLPRFEKRIIMSGSLRPNSIGELHQQIYLLDDGEALGKTDYYFKKRYMWLDPFKRRWEARPGAEEEIEQLVAPMLLRVCSKKDLNLPPLIEHEIWLDLPPEAEVIYRELEKQFLTQIEDAEIMAPNAGAKYIRLRGLANGGAYHHVYNPLTDKIDKQSKVLHYEKCKVVRDLAAKSSRPLLVAYQTGHDLERLTQFVGPAPTLKGGQSKRHFDTIIDAWNRGDIPLLYCQPASISHGLNLQFANGDVALFGLSDKPNVTNQLIKRLHRQGATEPVNVYFILMRNTVEEIGLERFRDKTKGEKDLLRRLQAYAEKHYGIGARTRAPVANMFA